MDDNPSDGRWSKRAMLKDALLRTKNKFKKSDRDYKTNEDIDEFLATGQATALIDQLTMLPSPTSISSSDPHRLVHPSQSIRRASAPKLNLAQVTRYPNAQPHTAHAQTQNDALLQPPRGSERCQSLSSLKGRGRRPRDLYVDFVSAPPVIIGEGGDEAEAPPIEVSRAKTKSRSLSPMARRPAHTRTATQGLHQSPDGAAVRRKPVPSPSPTRGPSPSRPASSHKSAEELQYATRSVADKELDQALNTGDTTRIEPLQGPKGFAPSPRRHLGLSSPAAAKSSMQTDACVADDEDALMSAVKLVVAGSADPEMSSGPHTPPVFTNARHARVSSAQASRRDPTYNYYHQR